MEDEVELIIESTKESMDKGIQHFEKELLKVRAGRASPNMLEGVKVDYYGALTPLKQVANINTSDARTINVQPWEKNLIPEIEKAILNSGLGLNPMNNGELVIINIPPLTEERRRDLVKTARTLAEDARISIRTARKEANDEIKKLVNDGLPEDTGKDLEKEVQDLTDQYGKRVDQIIETKEKEIMTV